MSKNRSLGREEITSTKLVGEGKNYLLAIGIDSYEHCPVLKNAVKDATDLAATLQEKYRFLPEQISLVTNEQATEFRIFAEFRKLIQKVKPDDNVLIFFSGHGHFDKDFKQGYWIPVDARAEAIGDYIPNSEISTTIRAIPSLHTFMIADACFSGSLFGESRSVFSKETPTIYHRKVGSMTSRWGLASGRNEIVSDGAPGENSPFSQNLLYFLKSNTIAPFTVSELVQYVKASTANNSEQTPIGSPLRNVGDKGGEFIFYPEGTQKRVDIKENLKPELPKTATRSQFHGQAPAPTVTDPLALKGPVFNWVKDNYKMLILIVLSTIFGGLWSFWLYLVIPILAVSIFAVTAIFDLKGVVKVRTTLVITLVGFVQFVLADRSSIFEEDKGVLESFIERTQNFEFLWFSLGLGCFAGFLYFFLTEREE